MDRSLERERERLGRTDGKLTEDVGLRDFKTGVDQKIIWVLTPSCLQADSDVPPKPRYFPTITHAVNNQKSVISLKICWACCPVAVQYNLLACRS